MLTLTDLFCGAGSLPAGAITVPDANARMAAAGGGAERSAA
ncbi:hypothetical protein AB0E78_02735 [Streptomyces sp. NPDC032198]